MTRKNWKIGDTYYQADGAYHGQAWDLGEFGFETEDENDAIENAKEWLAGLSERERQGSFAWVRKHQVTAVTESGEIATANSVGEAVWESGEKDETITFTEFWAKNEVKTIWLTSVGSPGGIELTHNVDTDGEDYCDLGELVNESQFDFLRDLTGVVTDGEWEWDGEGEGDPRYLTNSVLQLKAY